MNYYNCDGCGERFFKDELIKCNGQLVCDDCMKQECEDRDDSWHQEWERDNFGDN